jgi:hypothetical protein
VGFGKLHDALEGPLHVVQEDTSPIFTGSRWLEVTFPVCLRMQVGIQ